MLSEEQRVDDAVQPGAGRNCRRFRLWGYVSRFRPGISERQEAVIQQCLKRLFSHPMWDDPAPEIDSLLVSARKQDDLFNRKGLTERFVLHGMS
jgi:hypothetical protein